MNLFEQFERGILFSFFFNGDRYTSESCASIWEEAKKFISPGESNEFVLFGALNDIDVSLNKMRSVLRNRLNKTRFIL